ncbi:hypothetical protein [Streptomyces sp. NPDC001401]|uniref:hypothetical protein n=1 Tax=Streptomyces sp. NPDC001401 TaxID=3364570 RepID=UPI0036895310
MKRRLIAYLLRGARAEVEEVVRAYDRLPDLGNGKQVEIRKRVLFAAIRRTYPGYVFSEITKMVSFAFIVVEMMAIAILLTRFSPFGFRALSAGSFVFGFLLNLALVSRFIQGRWRLYLPSHLLLLASVESVFFTAILVAALQGADGDSAAFSACIGYFAMGVLALAIWILLLFGLVAVASSFRKKAPRLTRYDDALVGWVRLTARVWRDRYKLQNVDVAREHITSIESVARSVESSGAPGELMKFLDPRRRQGLRDDAFRMAEVFRAHKGALLKVGCAEDVRRAVESMMFGIEALAVGDRAALLENAPTEVARTDRLRRFFIWSLPPVTLIGAGMILPMIPAVASQEAASESLRWSLIVAGVLSLVAAQKDVAARINDTLGKAISWK